MHIEPGKSFGSAEANENERRWDERMIDRKNQDPTNHYDKTRKRLNFEIGPDRKIHPLGYQEKSLDLRLQQRLDELGWKPFKPDSKIQPNSCAKIIFGGNHERTLQMAFGNQKVSLEKNSDNGHLLRCKEIENWAMDCYDWCARRFGQENIIGFQVHLDESSPHIHALIVPVGIRPSSGRQTVMWSAQFGKDKYSYGQILKEMHTSLFKEVGIKYGLERGDSIEGRDVRHLSKRDYIRKLQSEIKQAEKAIKGLQTMIENTENELRDKQQQLERLKDALSKGRLDLDEYRIEEERLKRQIREREIQIHDKTVKLHEKKLTLDQISKELESANTVLQPFKNHKIEFHPPQISGKVSIFNTEKWVKEQNIIIQERFNLIVGKIEELYRHDAQKYAETIKKNIWFDYRELYTLREDNRSLSALNQSLSETMTIMLDQIAIPKTRAMLFSIADVLIGGGPIPASSGGGGSSSEDELRWDGRRPGEEEEEYRRRCLIHASTLLHKRSNRRTVGLRR